MYKLRRLKLDDLELRVQWMNDPRVYETMHFVPPITLEKTQDWFRNNVGNDTRMDFVIEEDGVVCAMDGLTGIDPKLRKGESYTIVDPNYKGKGIGTRTLFLKSIYAFEIGILNKIWAFIDADNIASIKMCERIGYKVEGILRQEVVRESGLIDRYYMGCLEDDLKKDAFAYEVINDEIILC
ncbi:GNAT family N-acetyltransferase [Aequorivita vladivostokensis]|uniref:N-acetyltransferase domain-containing protein n=1 Tax=Aequorivita vladivostokensis TaxID=171194 RepID=A0ABR5DJ82_9FLAO|nr:GNAT family protein [Aequorivita vladivostokensis]KJJ38839.1 hypothetical protein MB09_05170 [Aequorivita vladivostokensis]